MRVIDIFLRINQISSTFNVTEVFVRVWAVRK